MLSDHEQRALEELGRWYVTEAQESVPSRRLQTVVEVAAEKYSTLVLPFPSNCSASPSARRRTAPCPVRRGCGLRSVDRSVMTW